MPLMEWVSKEVAGGFVFLSDTVEGYAIIQRGDKFSVFRVEGDCDDIGPFEDFKQAEDVILKIVIALAAFEDKLWCASAAMEMPEQLTLLDGTANQLPEGPECEGVGGKV